MKNPARLIPLAEDDTRIVYANDISDVRKHDLVSMLHFKRYMFARDFCVNSNVLDVGCGTGYGCWYLSKHAKNVCGIDSSREAINFATSNFSNNNLFFKAGDACDIPFKDKKFDVVTCFDVIEHVKNHRALLAEIRRVLKPNGILLLSTPNKPISLSLVGTMNRFHKKEFDVLGLKAELKRFRKSVVLGQRFENKNKIRMLKRHILTTPYRVCFWTLEKSKVKMEDVEISDNLNDVIGFVAICFN